MKRVTKIGILYFILWVQERHWKALNMTVICAVKLYCSVSDLEIAVDVQDQTQYYSKETDAGWKIMRSWS